MLNATSLFLVLTSCVLLMTSRSAAWSQWSTHEDGLRARSCARTDESCTNSVMCCNEKDVCIQTSQASRLRYCIRIVKTPLAKPARASCESSQECEDGCCREYRAASRVRNVRMDVVDSTGRPESAKSSRVALQGIYLPDSNVSNKTEGRSPVGFQHTDTQRRKQQHRKM